MHIAFVTDSGASFPDFAPLQSLPLTVLHNHLLMQNGSVDDHDQGSSMPSAGQITAVVPPGVDAYAQVFAQLSRQSDAIVCICPTRRLSAHYEHAERAAATVGGAGPIKVIDSQSISAGQALFLVAIASALKRGASFDMLDQIARSISTDSYVMLCVEDITTLAHQQLLPAAHALFGMMLDMRPIISLDSGHLTAVGKARSRSNAIDRLTEFAQEFSHAAHIIILHDHVSQEMGTRLRERLGDARSGGQIDTLVYNPSLAALVGPGAFGIAIQEKLHE